MKSLVMTSRVLAISRQALGRHITMLGYIQVSLKGAEKCCHKFQMQKYDFGYTGLSEVQSRISFSCKFYLITGLLSIYSGKGSQVYHFSCYSLGDAKYRGIPCTLNEA